MKTGNLKTTVALASLFALMCGAQYCLAGEHGRLAAELARTVNAENSRSLATGNFQAPGQAEEKATRQRMSEDQLEQPEFTAMDAAAFEKLKGRVFKTKAEALSAMKALTAGTGFAMVTMQSNPAKKVQSPGQAEFSGALGDTKTSACVKSPELLGTDRGHSFLFGYLSTEFQEFPLIDKLVNSAPCVSF